MNTTPRPTTRKSFLQMLATLATLHGEGSPEVRKAVRQGYRHGKHNHRTVGAFGRRGFASR